jgi:hypothetical protein
MGTTIERFQEAPDQLGKHKTGKGYHYIRSLQDADESVLAMLLRKAATNLLNSVG